MGRRSNEESGDEEVTIYRRAGGLRAQAGRAGDDRGWVKSTPDSKPDRYSGRVDVALLCSVRLNLHLLAPDPSRDTQQFLHAG